MRAVPLARVFRRELPTTPLALADGTLAPVLTSTVGVKRGGAVGAHDAEVLKPIVVRNAVYVIEDQRHRAAAPIFALAAKLTTSQLVALRIEPFLQLAAGVVRVLDQDLDERLGCLRRRRSLRRPSVEMSGWKLPDVIDPMAKQRMIAAGGTEPESPQDLGVGSAFCDRRFGFSLGVPGHTMTLVSGADRTFHLSSG
jgi:hypothetical protein